MYSFLLFLLSIVLCSYIGITYFHGNPSSAGNCAQQNDLSGRLSVPVSVSLRNTGKTHLSLQHSVLLSVTGKASLKQELFIPGDANGHM